MGIWTTWIDFIESCIVFLSSQVGLNQAIAIIVFTLLARLVLMPISFKSAYEMYKNKLVVNKLKPELARLKEIYKENPMELSKRTMALYQKNQIKFFTKNAMLNLGTQGVLGLGLFQSLKGMAFNAKFMWIANIAKPDILLALLVGVLTFLSMVTMLGTAEQSTLILFIIPALFSAFILISFPSAIGLYWATTNLTTMGQTLFLRYVISKENCPEKFA